MCWDCYDHPKGDPYKVFKQGGVPIEDFDEPRYRHPKRRKKKNKIQRRPGCPENNYDKHVYVWVEKVGFYESNSFFRYYGYYKHQYEICCGCGHIGKKKHTDRYEKANMKAYLKRFGGNEFNVKRGEPLDWRTRRHYSPKYRWFSFENDDLDFKAAHRQWAIQSGSPTWYYS